MSTSAAPSRATILGRVIAWGIAGGLMTGWLHAGLVALQRNGGEGFAWFSRDFVWMAPLAYSMLFLGALVPVGVAGLVWRKAASVPVVAGAVTALGVFGLLLNYPAVATWASALLAAGTGAQVARLAGSRPGATRRIVSGVLLLLAPGTALTAFLVTRGHDARERAALAALPAAPAGAPNVLLIILDTVRAASLSLYGYPVRTTPALNRWASEGVVFDQAMAPAPWTLPTHAAIFTGRPASELSTQWVKPLDRTHRTLAEALRDKGYATAGVVANHSYTAWDSGLDRGFTRYVDYLVSFRQVIRSTSFTQTRLFNDLRAAGSMRERLDALLRLDLSIEAKHTSARRTADLVTREFLEWQATTNGRPFFAFLNYYDAHLPYYAPAGFAKVATGAGSRAAYENAIAWLDHNLDEVFTTLRSRGVLDQTIVIVTSDHGELFQEFGLSGHAHNVYLNTVRVPLMVRYPAAVPAGVRVGHEVTLRDLPATIGELSGLGDLGLPGTSLVPTFTGGLVGSPVISEVGQAPNVPREFPTATGDLVALFDSAHQFISSTDGSEHLFAYRDSVRQAQDLARDSAAVATVLRQRLTTLRPGHRRR